MSKKSTVNTCECKVCILVSSTRRDCILFFYEFSKQLFRFVLQTVFVEKSMNVEQMMIINNAGIGLCFIFIN